MMRCLSYDSMSEIYYCDKRQFLFKPGDLSELYNYMCMVQDLKVFYQRMKNYLLSMVIIDLMYKCVCVCSLWFLK